VRVNGNALSNLLAYDPDALSRLDALPPSDRVTEIATPAGTVVCSGGRKLHSGRDPVAEARRFARELDLADATVVVVLGFGSGHVVRAIAERSSADIVVFEPDLEVLRVGIRHGALDPRVRAVASPARLGEVLYSRLSGTDRGIVVRWAPSAREAPALYDAATKAAAVAVDRASLRHRTARIRGPGWLRHYLTNLPALARHPGMPAMIDALPGVPAIVVAAGPSLDENLDVLRTLQGRAIILAVNTAATALGRAGIRPTAIVSIESLDVSPQLASLPWLREVPAFLELTGNPALWSLPFAHKIPISVDTNSCAHFSTSVDAGHHLSAGFCVANAAVAIAHRMGCEPIVLVGSDLAYRGDKVYASGTSFGAMRAVVGDDGHAQLSGLEGKRAIEAASDGAGGVHMPDTARTLKAVAWGGEGEVTTTRDFAMFRDWYTAAARTMRQAGRTPINATQGGLHIPGWDDVPLKDALEGRTVADADQRFAVLLDRPATGVDRLVERLRHEADAALEIRQLAAAALRQIADDPDGELSLDEDGAQVLRSINARTRALLAGAPLCAEAVFAPIEELRARGHISTFTFYGALVPPLVELAEGLARASSALARDSQTTESSSKGAGRPDPDSPAPTCAAVIPLRRAI
jgi:hypothetical protein